MPSRACFQRSLPTRGRTISGLGRSTFQNSTQKSGLACTAMSGALPTASAGNRTSSTGNGSPEGERTSRATFWRWRARASSGVSSPVASMPRRERASAVSSFRRALDLDRYETSFHECAVLHAGGDLLSHETALVPVDAVQFVETVLEQCGAFHLQIAATVGYAERDA